MFLATTALQEFWSQDEELIFLGFWCLRDKIEKTGDINSFAEANQLLPDPWSDVSNNKNILLELNCCYENLFARLCEYLNSTHSTSYTQRYWRILVGQWLSTHINVVLNRYMHIISAFRRYPNLETFLLAPESFYTPWDMGEYVRLVIEDRYNLQIFSEILIALGFNFTMHPQNLYQDLLYDDQAHNSTLSRKSLDFNDGSFKDRSPTKVPHILMGEMCCDSPFLVQLAQSVQQFGSYWHHQSRMQPFPKETAISFDSRRLELLNIKASNSFERLVIQTLPQNFPGLYLEGFIQAREMTYKTFSSFPSVLVTLNDWYVGERFKFAAAEASQLGSRLVLGQHGGGYGGLEVATPELHEQAVSDRYCVWGWSDNQNGYQNLPSFKTSFLLNFKTYREKLWKQNSSVLLLSTCFFPYVAYQSRSPSNYEQVEFWQDLEGLLSSIPESLHEHVLWRAKFPDYGMPERNIIESQFPHVNVSNFKTWSDWAKDYHPSLNRARIIIVNNCSTSAVESLVLNVPTILYWRPEHWPLRPEAEPYFDELRRVGILWDNPETAASHLVSIYEKPWVWWERQEVQEVRQRFIDKYGQASDDWLNEWLSIFKEELSISVSALNSTIRPPKNYTTHPQMVARELPFLDSLEFPNPAVSPTDSHDSKNIIKDCYSVIRSEPHSSNGYKNLAKILQIKGRKNSALRAYLKAEQLQSKVRKDP